MSRAVPMVEAWRGKFSETVHRGHAVVCRADGTIEEAWGDPEAVLLPRSAVKMIQALPLVESGAADAFGLDDKALALACASHVGAPIHTDRVSTWLEGLGLDDNALACGPHPPNDRDTRHGLIRAGKNPCRGHNNCSGKHSGMLTLARHLSAPVEDYVAIDHPVQHKILEAFEDVTDSTSPGFGIDGCSAPNHAVSVSSLARGMAFFAGARADGGVREAAAHRLIRAMMSHPEMVNGEGRSCTELMRAMKGRGAVKTGADGSYVAILPDMGLGVAVKIEDGANWAQQVALTALLVHLGALPSKHPVALRWGRQVRKNHAGQVVGEIRTADGFPAAATD